MAPGTRYGSSIRMKPEHTRGGQLPIVLAPAADDLLSSSIHRHAVVYDVPPLVMLRHCLGDISSLRAVDLGLTDEQTSRVAYMFRTEVANVRRMSLSNIFPKCRRLIAAKPMQFCANCSRQANSNGPEPVPTKSTSRMASHLPAMWFAFDRQRQAFDPLPVHGALD